jgi:hypothetical protein
LLYSSGHVPGAVEDRRDERHHRRLLRRQEQLVGVLRVLGLPVVRPYQRKGDGRRPHQVAEGEPCALARSPLVPEDAVQGQRPQRRAAPRVSRRRDGAPEEAGTARGRAQPGGIRGHAHAHAGLPQRGRVARRPHSRRRRSMPTTGRSRPPTNSRSCTARTTSCRQRTRPSPTAASASAAATAGSR